MLTGSGRIASHTVEMPTPLIAACLSLLLLCSAGTVARSEEPEPQAHSLPELIARGLEHSGEIEEARWRVRGAEAQVRQARSASFLPRLRLNSEGGLVPEAEGDIFNPPRDTLGYRPLGPFNRTELEFVQPLYTFGQLSSLRRAAEGGLGVEEADLAARRLDLALEIKELYHGILLAQDLDDLVRRLSTRLEEERDRLEDDLSVPLSSRYKLRLALLDLENQAQAIAHNLELARAALVWKVGLPREQELELASHGLAPVQVEVPALDSLVDRARAQRPDWRKLQSGIAARGALTDAARSAYYPKVYFAGGLRYAIAPNRTDQHNPFIKDDYNYFSGGVFLGLRQSLEWHMLGADVARARAQHMELKAKERGAAQGIRLDVSRAYLDWERAAHSLERARERRKQTRQWLKLAQEEYDFDPGEIKELVRAFEAWALAEQEYFQGIFELNMAVARLARAAGCISLNEQTWH